MAAGLNTSYATTAGRDIPTAKPIGGKPVFVKHKDIPSVEEKMITNQDMYKCLSGSVQCREIKGVQKIGGLWRLYIESQEARIKLITSGLNMRNANIAVHDTNPFLTNGNENNLRLFIKDVPLSVHESLIIAELEKLKYKVVGPVIYQKLRVDGQLTDCLTGDRVVYIQQPSKALPRIMTFGLFKARIFHFGQFASSNQASVVCSRCLNEGHHRSQCNSPVVCRRCKQPGHLQLQCAVDFQTPPTSPRRDRASGTTPLPTGDSVPPAQAIDELISLGRQATASAVHDHDNQTRAQAPGSQARITQYFKGDRDSSQRPIVNTSTEASTPIATREGPPSDAHDHSRSNAQIHSHPCSHTQADAHTRSHSQSDASSEESLSDDDGLSEEISEISVESPELPKKAGKEKKMQQKKRKQKSLQKLPKKR